MFWGSWWCRDAGRPRSRGRRGGGALTAPPPRVLPRRPSPAPGAGYLPGGDVEPVEDVGRGDRQQKRGESFLVVVPVLHRSVLQGVVIRRHRRAPRGHIGGLAPVIGYDRSRHRNVTDE